MTNKTEETVTEGTTGLLSQNTGDTQNLEAPQTLKSRGEIDVGLNTQGNCIKICLWRGWMPRSPPAPITQLDE